MRKPLECNRLIPEQRLTKCKYEMIINGQKNYNFTTTTMNREFALQAIFREIPYIRKSAALIFVTEDNGERQLLYKFFPNDKISIFTGNPLNPSRGKGIRCGHDIAA